MRVIVTLEEMKNYLRVDFSDDDTLITTLITNSEKLCMDVLRTDSKDTLESCANGKIAVLYAVSYQYEHREEADFHELTLTLRYLLFGSREVGF
jgi:uncharacterized phage protein (predicted DNA packaging)